MSPLYSKSSVCPSGEIAGYRIQSGSSWVKAGRAVNRKRTAARQMGSFISEGLQSCELKLKKSVCFYVASQERFRSIFSFEQLIRDTAGEHSRAEYKACPY